MLWMTRASDETSSDSESLNKDFAKRHYGVMKQIAETIFSPVAFLDSKLGVVLVYDIDVMDINAEGTFRSQICVSES